MQNLLSMGRKTMVARAGNDNIKSYLELQEECCVPLAGLLWNKSGTEWCAIFFFADPLELIDQFSSGAQHYF